MPGSWRGLRQATHPRPDGLDRALHARTVPCSGAAEWTCARGAGPVALMG